MLRSRLLAALPPPRYLKTPIKAHQSANDIISEILEATKLYANDYELIAKQFDGGTATQTARNIFDFLVHEIDYKIENDASQSSKSPAIFLQQKNGDCKHYSLFTVGIMRALGYEIKFRFASYKLADNTPQHVYVIFKENSKWIPCDAVIKRFGYEKPYYYKQDFTPASNMALYRISGITEDVMSGDIIGAPSARKKARQAKRAVKKTARKARQAKRKAEGKGFFRKLGRGIAKVALTPARNAYLAMVGLNLKGMAKRLNMAIAKDPNKVKQFWTVKFKGNWKSLLKAVQRGSRKGQKFTPAKVAGMIGTAYYGDAQVGFVGEAALAAAAPIVIAAMELLKSILGKKSAEDAELTAEATAAIQANPEPSAASVEASTAQLEQQSTQIDKMLPPATASDYTEMAADYTPTVPLDAPPSDGADGMDTKKMLLYGGAALVGLKVLKII